MPMSKSPRDFPHIKEILDEAVARGGVRFTLNSDKQAWRWRAQAYHFRKLVQREAQEQAGLMGTTMPTPYDGMFIQLSGATCIIQFHQAALIGLTTLDGKPITEKTKAREPADDRDDLVDIASQVKKDLNLT